MIVLLIVSYAANILDVINRVDVPGAESYLLNFSPDITDVTFSIWKAEKGTSVWYQIPVENNISYSEDGSYTDNPELVLSPDETKLLIRRGGIWTDCLERNTLKACAGTKYIFWPCEKEWLAQSKFIQRITNLSPGPVSQIQLYPKLKGHDENKACEANR